MKSVWTNKKYANRKYTGAYKKAVANERNFILSGELKNGKVHTVSFESWQMAKSMGWKKVK